MNKSLISLVGITMLGSLSALARPNINQTWYGDGCRANIVSVENNIVIEATCGSDTMDLGKSYSTCRFFQSFNCLGTFYTYDNHGPQGATRNFELELSKDGQIRRLRWGW